MMHSFLFTVFALATLTTTSGRQLHGGFLRRGPASSNTIVDCPCWKNYDLKVITNQNLAIDTLEDATYIGQNGASISYRNNTNDQIDIKGSTFAVSKSIHTDGGPMCCVTINNGSLISTTAMFISRDEVDFCMTQIWNHYDVLEQTHEEKENDRYLLAFVPFGDGSQNFDVIDACQAQDAESSGMGHTDFGYFWNGSQCVLVVGDSCDGEDCDSGYQIEADCIDAYSSCSN